MPSPSITCGTAAARLVAPRWPASRIRRPSSGRAHADRRAGRPATSPRRSHALASGCVRGGDGGHIVRPRRPRCEMASPRQTCAASTFARTVSQLRDCSARYWCRALAGEVRACPNHGRQQPRARDHGNRRDVARRAKASHTVWCWRETVEAGICSGSASGGGREALGWRSMSRSRTSRMRSAAPAKIGNRFWPSGALARGPKPKAYVSMGAEWQKWAASQTRAGELRAARQGCERCSRRAAEHSGGDNALTGSAS